MTFERLLHIAKEIEIERKATQEREIAAEDVIYWTGDRYESFAERIETEREAGTITHEEYVELALTAFYDYDIVDE